jgi:hypothetical protein
MTATAQPTRRVNRGKGHSYYLDGQPVPGITTVLNAYPKPALIQWAANEAAQLVLDQWDDLTAMSPSQRYNAVRNSRYASSDEGKVRGTDVHKLVERHLSGEEIAVPEHLAGFVDAYEQFLDDWQVAELIVERPFYSRRCQYAGTPDLVAKLNDGQTWLLDWKTTAKGVFPENVLQLAAARFADFTLDDNGVELPLPKIDATGIVWLRADGYDLVPVEANEQAFRVFLYVKQLHDFIGDDRALWIRDALPREVER